MRTCDTASEPWTFEATVHFGTSARGRRRLHEGEAPPPEPLVPGNVPRVARLLALAHRFEDFLRRGEVRDQAELARLLGVTRARISQILNLLLLAPELQEAVLDLPRTVVGRDAVTERDVRAIAAEPLWTRQRALWRDTARRAGLPDGN